MTRLDQRGQALVELSLSLGLAVVFMVGPGLILEAEWQRLRCANRVFEATHRVMRAEDRQAQGAVATAKGRALALGVSITTSDVGFRGEARCGSVVETVNLPRLASDSDREIAPEKSR